MSILIFGCSRYNYYPRGIQHEDNKRVAASNRTAYIVKYGDTLYSIGRKLGIDFHRLAKMNDIRRPYTIFVGQRLYTNGSVAKKHTKQVNKLSVKTSKAKAKIKHETTHKTYPKASYSRIKLQWPVKGRLSGKFGPRKNRMHDGIDLAAKAGTHVFAAAAGKVVYADSRLSGYGNLIIIRHSSDMFTAYAHNQKNLVVAGQQVKAGQHIANVGATGRATGAHLHFEVRRGETAVDPLAYLPRK
ncbi:M23 family metallopeptidase [Ghiorsea bivora]|uniref:M23 family metallopeptidase n=1 Tax=Ghiorsea bivora TaxID=1485545 RepID=UPI00068AA893|nr:M23 family metallopeptidase [Ghiorsea bivora]